MHSAPNQMNIIFYNKYKKPKITSIHSTLKLDSIAADEIQVAIKIKSL